MYDLKQLEALLTQGKITRREFIGKVSALGLAAAVSPALSILPAEASAPKKGGRFRAGVSGFSTSDSLDPATLNDLGNAMINWQLRNNLVETDHLGRAVPELAETIEPSPDAAKWVFRLRKGIEFHNGKTLEAEDVIWSVNHHRGKESKSGAKALLDQIGDIRANGKNTVIFKLKGRNADFPYILSDYHLSISPAGTGKTDWNKGIGTGGYLLKDFEPGVRAFTVRNPNYWKQGRAHFDEVETLGISDVNARTNALKTGRIDWMNRCDLKTVHLLKSAPGIRIIRVAGMRHFTMPMLTDLPPYNNNDVRLALKHAIDRDQILKLVFRGYGTPGNDHPIAPGQRFYAADLPQRRYDPDKARFLMKKAGLQNHTFKLHTSTFNGFTDHALLYKQHAARAGISIDLVHEPADGYWANVWMKKPWASCTWNGRVTADAMLSVAYKSGAPWNDTHFQNEHLDRLIMEARSELDENRRREMYRECQKILRDQGGVIVYAFKDHVEAASDKVRYGNLAGNFDGDGYKAAERWWFSS